MAVKIIILFVTCINQSASFETQLFATHCPLPMLQYYLAVILYRKLRLLIWCFHLINQLIQTVSLCPAWPGGHCVDQEGPELIESFECTETHLSLLKVHITTPRASSVFNLDYLNFLSALQRMLNFLILYIFKYFLICNY